MLNNSVNAVEVLEMARDIEKRGRNFYLGRKETPPHSTGIPE